MTGVDRIAEAFASARASGRRAARTVLAGAVAVGLTTR